MYHASLPFAGSEHQGLFVFCVKSISSANDSSTGEGFLHSKQVKLCYLVHFEQGKSRQMTFSTGYVVHFKFML